MTRNALPKSSIIPIDTGSIAEVVAGLGAPSALARIGRTLLLKQFEGLRDGELRLIEADGQTHCFGARTARLDLAVTLHVHHSQLFADAAFGGTVGAVQRGQADARHGGVDANDGVSIPHPLNVA